MEIKSVAVENFRSHEKFELELAKVTILTGPNGAGKSSILEAVATTLIGTNTWVERDGIKLSMLIMKGKKNAVVSVIGKSKISRTISGSGSKILLNDETPLTQFELLSNLKVNDQQVKASLVPQAFLTLPAKEQKDSLFALLGTRLTLEDVAKYIPQAAMETWAKLATRWEEDHGEDGQNPVVDIDKLYAFCYDARKNYKAKAKPTQANPEREGLQRELGELQAKIGSANFENERLKSTKAEVARIPGIEKRLAIFKDEVKDMTGLEEKFKAAAAEVLDLSKKLAVVQADLERIRGEAAQFQKVKVSKGQKVACPIGLECPHDEASLKSKKTHFAGLLVAKEGEEKSFKTKLKDAEDRTESYRDELNAGTNRQSEIHHLENDLKKLLDLKADGQEVDVQALKDRKDEITKKLAATEGKPAEPDRTVERLNAIVEAMDVHGIKTQLVQKGITALEDEANESLRQFGPYRIRFFVESEFRPTIIHRGVESSVGELSEGERLVTSLILQDVFAQRSGVNLVVVDNVDLLDREAYQRFITVAQSLKSKVLVGLANESHGGASTKNVKVVSLGLSEEKARPEERSGSSWKKPIEDIL